MATLNVFCNAALPAGAAARLERELAGHNLLRPAEDGRVSFGARGRPDPALERADVAFGQPDPEQVIAAESLRWVHLTSAGYTSYDREDLRASLRRRGAALTKSSLVYDEPCAEHVLAFMLAHARQLPAAMDNQRGPRGWPVRPLRSASRLLAGQSVVLIGFGSIGRRLAELLGPLGVRMVGIRRSVTGDEPVPMLALGDPTADRALAGADHVVDLLPASAATERYFDEARLRTLKPGAVFYNIGRGTTVDQAALAARLESGDLAAAYLDVTDPEPLPPTHPLWSAPRCLITPHTGGGHADEADRLVAHFLENLHRFIDGRPLLDRVV